MVYRLEILIQGYPGKTRAHGALGWSTVGLLVGGEHRILVDVSSFGTRPLLLERLRAKGLGPEAITAVLLTHAHWDHSVNWTLFPRAQLTIGERELAWALREPPGGWHVPELSVRELARSPRLRLCRDGDEVAPGITVHEVPGHTPGHLAYIAQGDDRDVLFTGDAAKNRAELLSRHVDMTLDAASSLRSLDRIWELWRARPGTVLVPGHDVHMVLDRSGAPRYLAERDAAIEAWLAADLADVRTISLA